VSTPRGYNFKNPRIATYGNVWLPENPLDMNCRCDYLGYMISDLKVKYLYDKESTREHIIEVFSECDGNMRKSAEKLGCHYHTLLRIIKADDDLSRAIIKERERMHAAGIQQRGFGKYQRGSFE
tara:strand:+ start:132 stop:503 length:372 start_codon:yes stop_codon:yes gene_type:complete